MKGSIDGIDLSHFEVGQVYDVGTTLANYLLASRYAIPIADEKPDVDDMSGRSRAHANERDKAADRKNRQ